LDIIVLLFFKDIKETLNGPSLLERNENELLYISIPKGFDK